MSAIRALLVVYIAALCGWDLNDNHEPISILINAVGLATDAFLVYTLAREGKEQQ